MPAGVTYSWVDPEFAQSALRTTGYKTSQVKVIYADGSNDIVLATVHVTGMAETAAPTPQPITIDADNPYLPDNLNNPDSPTPAIDPSTLPSGTLVRFPDGVEPKNLTPGDHPTQIEIDYPDGTSTIVPTIIHVPAKSQTPGNEDSLMPGYLMPGNSNGSMPSANSNVSLPNSELPSVPTTPAANNNGTVTVPGATAEGTNSNKAAVKTNNDHDQEVPPAPSVHQKLVIYIGKNGRIVKRAYIAVGRGYQSVERLFKLAKDKLPKGYQATGKVKKVAKHLDVWVSKKGQPNNKRAPRTKDVLYITKDGKIVKRTRIKGDVNKLAQSKMPKGYHISGISRVHNHYDVWVKKNRKQEKKG